MVDRSAPIPPRPDFARQLDRVARAKAGRASRRAGDGGTLGGAGRSSAGRTRQAPWLFTRACLLLGTVGVLKLSLLASVGEAAYSERAARLAEGNWAERGAAWVIQPDPVTVAVRNDLARFTSELSPL